MVGGEGVAAVVFVIDIAAIQTDSNAGQPTCDRVLHIIQYVMRYCSARLAGGLASAIYGLQITDSRMDHKDFTDRYMSSSSIHRYTDVVQQGVSPSPYMPVPFFRWSPAFAITRSLMSYCRSALWRLKCAHAVEYATVLPHAYMLLPEIRAEGGQCSPMSVHRVECWHTLLMAVTEPHHVPHGHAQLPGLNTDGAGLSEPLGGCRVAYEPAASGMLVSNLPKDIV